MFNNKMNARHADNFAPRRKSAPILRLPRGAPEKHQNAA